MLNNKHCLTQPFQENTENVVHYFLPISGKRNALQLSTTFFSISIYVVVIYFSEQWLHSSNAALSKCISVVALTFTQCTFSS